MKDDATKLMELADLNNDIVYYKFVKKFAYTTLEIAKVHIRKLELKYDKMRKQI